MSSPLPSNMAMTTIRGRYGSWSRDNIPVFVPIKGMQVTFTAAYPFVTNVSATPTPLVIATKPRTFQTDASGYLCDPDAGFDGLGNGLNRNCLVISSDDPDINPSGWLYLVTFTGPGATNFRSFRTPAMSETTVDIAVLTPQRVAPGTAPTQAEIAAANAAASAAAAQQALATLRRGQAGGVAALDADGDVNDADGVKVLPGGSGGSGGTPDLANITGMSNIGKSLVATQISGSPASASLMRGVLGAGTGNSNLVIGTITGTAADAALTTTALNARALNSDTVHRTGDEQIDGTKQFLDPMLIVPAIAGDNPVTLSQMNGAISAVTGTSSSVVIQDFLDSPTAADARFAIGASSLVIGTTTGTAADGGVVASHTAALATPVTWDSLSGKPTVFPSDIPSVSGLSEELSGREGNLVVIYGAASARLHPADGGALGLNTTVLWITDGTAATNAVDGDITLNRSLV